MVENPYYHRTPIRDQRFFFGRTKETHEILECVVNRQPVSIVGPRRIGKTSLLFHLCDSHVKADHGVGDDYMFVYVTCEILSGAQNKHDAYRVLLRRAAEAMPGDHSAEHSSQEPMTYLDFEKRLDEITAPSLKIVILLDEFGAIAGNRQLGKGFFDELRALGQTGKVIYVTASSETLYNLSFHDESVLNSPFFNFFSPVQLGSMEWRDARDLIDGTAAIAGFEGFDENDYEFLRRIAGPHPFYLQVVCYHLFKEKIGSYLVGATSALADAQRALDQGRAQKLEGAMDELRSNCERLGATALVGLSQELKNRVTGGELESARELLVQIVAEYERTLGAFGKTRRDLEEVGKTGLIALDYDLVESQFTEDVQDHYRYAWDRLSYEERKALKKISEGHSDEVTAKTVKSLHQKCLLYQDEIFSTVFAKFVAGRFAFEDTIEVTTETGEKRQVRITKPPLIITNQDLRESGTH